jgi:hypothetical protein
MLLLGMIATLAIDKEILKGKKSTGLETDS